MDGTLHTYLEFFLRQDTKLSRKMRKLSERELEVLLGMLRGKTNQELAEILFLSVKTIKFHITSIFAKLGFRRRLSLITTLLSKFIDIAYKVEEQKYFTRSSGALPIGAQELYD